MKERRLQLFHDVAILARLSLCMSHIVPRMSKESLMPPSVVKFQSFMERCYGQPINVARKRSSAGSRPPSARPPTLQAEGSLLVTLLVTRTLVLKEIEEMLAKNQNPDMRRWSDVWMKIFCLVSSVRCCLSFVSCFLQTRLRIGVRSTPYGPIGFRQTRKGCVLSQPSSPYPSLHTVKDPNHCPAACCVSRPSKGYMQLIHVSYSLRTICAVHCFP
ncbi:hypothetical protein Y032_0089g2302 [Ancylostoma ceylanicum]|nr:hypothetical protein Y032_0089g2302 [Ancylostoma ceylanicum]